MDRKKVLSQNSWSLMITCIVGGLALATSLLLLVTSAWLISAASLKPAILELEVAIVLVRLFGISRGAIRYLSRILEHEKIFSLNSKIRIDIFRSLVNDSNPAKYKINTPGFLSRVNTMIEQFNNRFLRLLIPSGNLIFLTLITSGFYLFFSVKIFLILFPSYLLVIFVISLILRSYKKGLKQDNNSLAIKSELISKIDESIRSLPESLIFGYSEIIQSEISNLQSQLLEIERGRSKKEVFWQTVVAISFISIFFVTLISTLNQFFQGSISNLLVAPFILAIFSLFEPIFLMPNSWALNEEMKNSHLELENLLTFSNIEIVDSFSSVEKIDQILELEFIEFGAQIEGRNLLKINQKLFPGQILFISAPSGGGKSTFIESLIGNLPNTGKIKVKKRNLDSEILDNSDLSLLLQRDHLFNTSIRENFKLANTSINDEMIWELLDLVEIGGCLRDRGLNLDFQIANYQCPFSGGEMQRIKWARSMARKSQLYIWDEPCEYLDQDLIERILPSNIDYIKSNNPTSIFLIISHIDLKPILSNYDLVF